MRQEELDAIVAAIQSQFGQAVEPSDQRQGRTQPPLTQPVDDDLPRVDLPQPSAGVWRKTDLARCLAERVSVRDFADTPVSLEQLAALLWATQGVRSTHGQYVTLRQVPSAGARHPLETHLAVNAVEDLTPGLYRYLPLTGQLAGPVAVEQLPMRLSAAALGQGFVGACPVCFIWTAVPYRCAWRYGREAGKLISLDAGHVAQNLYLAAESLGLGTCAIAAYDQEAFDRLLGVNGADELTVYLAPVGIPAGS